MSDIGGAVTPVSTFKNHVGEIRNLVYRPMASFAELTSSKGSVRANHWHRTDWHYAYVVKGKVLYFERPIGDKAIPIPEAFYPGDTFYTPPCREHAMLFAEDTTIITLSGNVRTHENHEADLVRVEFITPEIASRYL